MISLDLGCRIGGNLAFGADNPADDDDDDGDIVFVLVFEEFTLVTLVLVLVVVVVVVSEVVVSILVQIDNDIDLSGLCGFLFSISFCCINNNEELDELALDVLFTVSSAATIVDVDFSLADDGKATAALLTFS
jgi:hypothetical protein